MTEKKTPKLLHEQAMDLADEAQDLVRHGHPSEADEMFKDAAKLEEEAADLTPDSSPVTRDILRRSAVSLWGCTEQHQKTIDTAERYLKQEILPGFACEIRELHNHALHRLHEMPEPEEP